METVQDPVRLRQVCLTSLRDFFAGSGQVGSMHVDPEVACVCKTLSVEILSTPATTLNGRILYASIYLFSLTYVCVYLSRPSSVAKYMSIETLVENQAVGAFMATLDEHLFSTAYCIIQPVAAGTPYSQAQMKFLYMFLVEILVERTLLRVLQTGTRFARVGGTQMCVRPLTVTQIVTILTSMARLSAALLVYQEVVTRLLPDNHFAYHDEDIPGALFMDNLPETADLSSLPAVISSMSEPAAEAYAACREVAATVAAFVTIVANAFPGTVIPVFINRRVLSRNSDKDVPSLLVHRNGLTGVFSKSRARFYDDIHETVVACADDLADALPAESRVGALQFADIWKGVSVATPVPCVSHFSICVSGARDASN
jgi:hypothetical protein